MRGCSSGIYYCVANHKNKSLKHINNTMSNTQKKSHTQGREAGEAATKGKLMEQG